MSDLSVRRTPVQNIINGWKKSWSVRLSSRAEGSLVKRFEKHVSDHLVAMEAKDREIEGLRAENTAMYGAILEAADSGSIRCKLELQRIAAEDAGRKE